MSVRKKIWDHFYALVVADILIYHQIKSPTLKVICDKFHNQYSYSSILEDLLFFFRTAEVDKILEFSAIIIEETYDKEIAQEFIKHYHHENNITFSKIS